MCRIDDVLKIIESSENNIKERAVIIGDFQEKISLVEKIIEGKFYELAQKYEDPSFLKEVEIGYREIMATGPKEPFGKEAKEQQAGSTTLNRCGWCKFSVGKKSLYNYLIDNSCSFFEDDSYPPSQFNQECKLKQLVKNNDFFTRIRHNLSQKYINKLLGINDFCKATLSTIKKEISVFR